MSKLLFFLAALAASAQTLTPNARRQIAALLAEKAARNPAQAKMDSHLVHAAAILRGQPVHPDFPVPPLELESVRLDAANQVEVDVTGEVTRGVLGEIVRLGGSVVNTIPEHHTMRARLPLLAVEQLAGNSAVRLIRVADQGHSSTGPDTTGDVAHQADVVRQNLQYDGTGVKIGLLSDGLNSLASEQAAGRLPNVNIITGQRGSGDEGTALLEIIYTLAPGATLYFATALGSQASMARNIQALADAGCQIIIDDWTYFAEGVFQDGTIARTVNALSARGVFYFSCVQNSGSLLKGNSGTWEGDFLDSGLIFAGIPGQVHNFGAAGNIITSDTLTRPTPQTPGGFNGEYHLKWSDPLGSSANDYDLFILDSGLTQVLGSSTNVQNGSQDPDEFIFASPSIPAGSQVVIVKHVSAAVRALHLDTERGRLAVATTGATFGHNAASGAFTIAAADVQNARGGAFTGGPANPSYALNSDGPRRMFYAADGSVLTPGNLLFGSVGGIVLNKPDVTAADCVPTQVPGYLTFCGSSAAAAHAGAIAALVLQASPPITVAQMRAALTASALDIEGPGFDINSGAGIVMAPGAVSAALHAAPAPVLSIASAHTGSFTAGQSNAAYTLTVTNAPGASPTTGPVYVTDALPPGLTLVSAAGRNWRCGAAAGQPPNTCTQSDSLMPGASYDPVTVTASVSAGLSGTVVNTATVSGGGAPSAVSPPDATTILPGTSPSDLALSKPATQSSTYPGLLSAAAGSAVDGSTDGNLFDGSVTATNLDANAWWQVDVGATASIGSIVVWNRTDCCGSRLSDFWVFVSSTPFLPTDTPSTLQNRAGTFASHQITAPNPNVSIPVGAQGRYVRVQLSGTNYLSLAEVQVFGAAGPTNVAQGRIATESSQFPGAPPASAAVDGNIDGNFNDGSVTATNQNTNAWWQVDLGASSAVSSVVIWNRTDCCASRLSDYWVFISDIPFLAADTPATLQNRASTLASHQLGAPSPSTTISLTAQGRYVRVQLSGTDYLSLAEVQVFGTGGASAPVNQALGKPAAQSSTLLTSGGGASVAVDGSTDGNFYDNSVTATNLDPNAWWQVDLGTSPAISSVVVWNRTDCCGSRLSDFWVFVSNTPFLATDTPAMLQNRAGTFASHQTTAPSPNVSIPVAQQGRYVRVQLSFPNYLSLAEVQVFGQ